jgi:hypothetical protein
MKRAARRTFLGLALAALILPQWVGSAVACPNCKEAVSATDTQVASTSRGYNWSVLFMLAVPFSMLGTGAFMIRRAAKRGLLPEL